MRVDRNVSVYLKVNELVVQVNEHAAALRMMDAVFNEMNAQAGLWGWLTRLCFSHFFETHMRMQPEFVTLLDVPPVIPGTKEIRSMDHDQNGSEDPTERCSEGWAPVASLYRTDRAAPRPYGRQS